LIESARAPFALIDSRTNTELSSGREKITLTRFLESSKILIIPTTDLRV